MATTTQITNFFNTIGPIAVKVCKERGYGNAQAWTCICQAACESNYGTSTLMKNANAYFGIKASASWVKAAKYGGLVYNAGTKECYDGKTYTNITACFRAYNSMEDSVNDYFDLMETSRYKKSLTTSTVNECITIIKNSGYATSPTYINTINTIYKNYKTKIEAFSVKTTTTIQTTVSNTSSTTQTTSSTTTTTKKSNEEVAKEVVKGLWGNGTTRKAKLEAAGYDYATIQKLVNKLLK
jgi:flagellum-specific peptidoglycan hydrolase FlgJ